MSTPLPITRPRRHHRGSAHTRTRTQARSGMGVHDYARQMSFLTELDSQTWLNRYSASEWLVDPGAVSSVSGYATWLRRVAGGWVNLGLTYGDLGGRAPEATPSLDRADLDLTTLLDLDLRDLAIAAGGPRSAGSVIRLQGGATARSAASDPREPTAVSVVDGTHDVRDIERTPDLDAATGSAFSYAVLCLAQDVSALAADVAHLAEQSRSPLPQRFVQHCAQLNRKRSAVRRELLRWGAGTDVANRDYAVTAARNLTENLATGLVRPRGW